MRENACVVDRTPLFSLCCTFLSFPEREAGTKGVVSAGQSHAAQPAHVAQRLPVSGSEQATLLGEFPQWRLQTSELTVSPVWDIRSPKAAQGSQPGFGRSSPTTRRTPPNAGGRQAVMERGLRIAHDDDTVGQLDAMHAGEP
ncbi:uncharacterized protein PADG_11566 [Paracoccidioides brasiliensis Pb18]|uniref:Uncharacterized protein n=1 Tax=Paracoccidioides brasiliensis (strain Pb18) TaxID=502780 RepID=A0A0A0HUT2_PARBD|nr:uncharacterized protein PADG_11566 [Paracoccidioides brasiliensis Pb18]KGM92367.1 hypothetical protein PADG_11566 [Paracoccidioides brasiliensis Pb18]